MSFEKSIDQFIYHGGSEPRCAGSRVHETWQIELGQPLQRQIFSHQIHEPVEKWTKWLTETQTASAASLKVLVIRTKPISALTNDAPPAEHAQRLRKVFETAKLPVAGLGAYLRNLAQYSCVPSTVSAGPSGCSFFFSDPAAGWTWSYCPETRSTRAIFLCRDIDTNDRQEACRALLERHTEFVDQPLLLAYVCTEDMGIRACKLISDLIIPEVLQIERSTGLETWNPATEEVLDRLPNAYGEADSLRVVLYSQRVTDIQFRLLALCEYVPIVRGQNQRHAQFLRTQFEMDYPGLKESLERNLQLDEIMQYLHEYLNVRLLKVKSLAKRLDAQTVAVEKIQALKMSQESQLIAEDSKRIAQDSHLLAKEGTRDSKGMMTIAVVTMVFLPGTFTAAFFAMPIFQWDASENGQLVNPRIWLYWAITVPLTCLVLGVWVLYRTLSNRKEKTEDVELVGLSYRATH